MNLVVYRTWEALSGALRERWNALLRRSAANTFFLSWEWCESWWKIYGGGRTLYVLAAWEEDALVGLAPLYVERVRRAGLSWSVLRLIGDGSDDSDYLDCFTQREAEPQFAEAILDHLQTHREAWDYLEFHGPVASSPFVSALLEGFARRKWEFVSQDVPCLTLRLPATWNEYAQALKPRFRTKMRSGLTFFEQQLKVEVVECASEEQLREWLPIFFNLHGKRWQSKGRTGVFGGQAKRDFYLEVSRAALRAGVLSFHRLDWGGRALAFQYGFVYENRFLLLQEGYDPAFESLRPGLALRGFRLRDMIAAGVEEYDFLAGVAPHKIDWGAEPKRALKIGASASPLAALAFLRTPAAWAQTKESLRQHTPEFVLALRKKLQTLKSGSPAGANAEESKAPVSLRSLAAGVYAATPLRRLGRWTADRYQLGTRGGRSFSLARRTTPVCQIFLYHRVNDDRDPFLPSLPVDEFRRQMEHIARNFQVVTLDDIAEGRIGANDSKYSVAVTFDDGYRDNFTCAFPILKELGVPATIYLATGYIGTGLLPWYDEVCLAFKLTVRPFLNLDLQDAPAGPMDAHESRLALLDKTLDWLRSLENEARRAAMSDLFRALGSPSTLALPNYMLNWDEIRQMRAHNIGFGAHTVTHPVLSRLAGRRLQEEIVNSRKTLEQKLQTEVRHFAYPFGRPDHFNQEARQVIEQNGFKTAVTTVFGFNTPGDDPFTLKRFTPWGQGQANFMLQLDWYRFAGVRPTQERHTQGNAALSSAPLAGGLQKAEL